MDKKSYKALVKQGVELARTKERGNIEAMFGFGEIIYKVRAMLPATRQTKGQAGKPATREGRTIREAVRKFSADMAKAGFDYKDTAWTAAVKSYEVLTPEQKQICIDHEVTFNDVRWLISDKGTVDRDAILEDIAAGNRTKPYALMPRRKNRLEDNFGKAPEQAPRSLVAPGATNCYAITKPLELDSLESFITKILIAAQNMPLNGNTAPQIVASIHQGISNAGMKKAHAA